MKNFRTYFLLFIFLGTILVIPVLFLSNSANNSFSNSLFNNELDDDSDTLILRGNAEERGTIYGKKCRLGIQKNIALFWEDVNDAGFSKDEVIHIVKQMEQELKKEDPDDFIEYRAIAKAAHVSYEDILAFNLFTSPMYESDELEHGCTGWIAHGSATSNGNTLMHKNRDEDRLSQVIVIVEADGNDNGYRAILTEGKTIVSVGINDKGLATGNVYVNTLELKFSWSAKGSLTMNKEILQECDNVDEVFDYMDGITPRTGGIQFCADKDKAAIIEYTPKRFTTPSQSIIQNDVGYRSNYFTVLTDANNPTTPSDTKIIRYNAARDFCEERKGTLTSADFNELSRHHYEPSLGTPSEHDGVDGSISNYHTLFGATFEIDSLYPTELSVMWAAIGTPCTAIYAPIHLGSASVNSRWSSDDAWDLAELILDQQDDHVFPFGSLVPHYLEIEAELELSRMSIIDDARTCLDSGLNTQARTILTDFDKSSGNQVYSEMELVQTKRFWEDSFHYLNGISSLDDISWCDENELIMLESGENDGYLRSVPISHGSDWTDCWFVAEQTIPQDTNIEYKILDSSDNAIYMLSADDAEQGFDLSGISLSSIKLEAFLTSETGIETPSLYEWTVFWDPDWTPVDPDIEPPAQVTGLSATTLSDSSILLDWIANSESDLDHYNVYRNDQIIAYNVIPNEYTDTGLTADTSYSYQISAVDTSGNEGPLSTAASATTEEAPQPDTEPPAQVTGLSATALSATSISLDWNANSESDLDHYNVYRDGQVIASNVIPSEFTDTGLIADTSYSYQISAVDTSGNEGTPSTIATATTDELQQQVMYISFMDMDYSKRTWFWSVIGYRIYIDLTIVDGNGLSLSGVSVSIQLDLPDGDSLILSAITDSNGELSVDEAVDKVSGTYVSSIISLSKDGYVYDPSRNEESQMTNTIII